jgi:hypothetical protein
MSMNAARAVKLESDKESIDALLDECQEDLEPTITHRMRVSPGELVEACSDGDTVDMLSPAEMFPDEGEDGENP